MRVDVKKYFFFGPESQQESFFEKAQEASIIEFINPCSRNALELSQPLQRMHEAIKLLKKYPCIEQVPFSDRWSAQVFVEHVFNTRHEIERLQEESSLLQLEIARIEAFGCFSMESIRRIEQEGHCSVRFFSSKIVTPDSNQISPELLYITFMHGLYYYISIGKKPQEHPNIIEMRIDTSLEQAREKYDLLNEKISDIQTDIAAHARYTYALHDAFLLQLDRHHLAMASKCVEFALNEKAFVVEGWVSKKDTDKLEHFLRTEKVMCEEIALEKGESPPTHLVNEGMAKLGEDLVNIYDVPSNTDKDPSLWVFCFFTIFFAFIMADAGYGLLLLLTAFAFRLRFPKITGAGKRLIKMCAIFGGVCIAWGFLTSSFFGIHIDLHNPIRQSSLIQWIIEKKAGYLMEVKNATYQDWLTSYPKIAEAKTPLQFIEASKEGHGYFILSSFYNDILLELALLLGIIHISFSFLKSLKERWAGLGWIIFMIASYLYFPLMLNACTMFNYILGIPVSFAPYGEYIIYSGIGLAMVSAVIQHKGEGILEFMNVIQIFCDVLSYLRLYALALAGIIMAETFNNLGADAGWFLGFFIIVIGQSINFALSIMGGVIHGLRLNFLEWYHYCFVGGGRLFKPLVLLNKKENT